MGEAVTEVTAVATEAVVVAAPAVEPVAHQSSSATSHGPPPSTSSVIFSPAAARSTNSAFWSIARLTAPEEWVSVSSAHKKNARAQLTVSTDTRSMVVNFALIMHDHVTKKQR